MWQWEIYLKPHNDAVDILPLNLRVKSCAWEHLEGVLAGELKVVHLAGIDVNIEDLSRCGDDLPWIDAVHRNERVLLIPERFHADSVRVQILRVERILLHLVCLVIHSSNDDFCPLGEDQSTFNQEVIPGEKY